MLTFLKKLYKLSSHCVIPIFYVIVKKTFQVSILRWCFCCILHFLFCICSFSFSVSVQIEVTVCVALRMVQNGAPKRFQLMENHRHSVQVVLLPLQQPIVIRPIFQRQNLARHFWHKPIGHLSRNYLKLVVIYIPNIKYKTILCLKLI